MVKKTILILAAVENELEYFNKHYTLVKKIDNKIHYYEVKEQPSIRLALTGVGTLNAAVITTSLIHFLSPAMIFNIGSAGSLNINYGVGDIILGEVVLQPDIQGLREVIKNTPFENCLAHPQKNKQIQPLAFYANVDLIEKALSIKQLNPKLGKLASTDAFPAPKALFSMLQTMKIDAIDMESAAIYQACWLFDTPCLAIRSISNAVDEHNNHDSTDISVGQAEYNAAAFCDVLITDTI